MTGHTKKIKATPASETHKRQTLQEKKTRNSAACTKKLNPLCLPIKALKVLMHPPPSLLGTSVHRCVNTCLSEAKVDVAQARVPSPDAGGADHIRCLQDFPLSTRAQPTETLLVCGNQLALMNQTNQRFSFGDRGRDWIGLPGASGRALQEVINLRKTIKRSKQHPPTGTTAGAFSSERIRLLPNELPTRYRTRLLTDAENMNSGL